MATPPTEKSVMTGDLERILDIPVEITVELGNTEMFLRDVMSLTLGSLVELDKKTGDPVNLYVNRKLVAQGEVVLVENNLAIKIIKVMGTDQPESMTSTKTSP